MEARLWLLVTVARLHRLRSVHLDKQGEHVRFCEQERNLQFVDGNHAQSKSSKGFCHVSTHQKPAWWVRAIMQRHSQCVGWSGFLDGFECFDGWQPKGSGKFIPIEDSGGPGLKFPLICPRSQPVDKGFGSGIDMALQSGFVLFLGSSKLCTAFSIVDLTSHVQSHICQVQRQAPCSGKFACLGNHPSLATRL